MAQSFEEAFKYYKEAAEKGNSLGINNLGSLYEGGKGVPQSTKEALQYYRTAADMGCLLAMTNLGRLLGNPPNEEDRSPQEAIKWLSLAGEKGQVSAWNHLGNLFAYHGNGKDGIQLDKAVDYYTKAAEGGDVEGMNNLGHSYFTGKGVSQSPEKTVQWFQRGAEKGHSQSLQNLGLCYGKGSGISTNFCEAARCFLASNCPAGYHALAELYRDGKGVKQDYAEAMRYAKLAGDYGDALFFIGTLYAQGLGVEKSEMEAARYFKLAGEKGNPLGYYNLAEFYSRGVARISYPPSEVVKYYKLAASQGVPQAYLNLGRMYMSGSKVNLSYSQAFQYFQLAAKEQIPEAMVHLGIMYENGWEVKRSLDQAIHYYSMAAERGAGCGQYVRKLLDDIGNFLKCLLIRLDDKRNALHHAIEQGNLQLVKDLVANGTDVNKRMERLEWVPLQIAVLKRDLEAVKLLVSLGANVNLTGKHSWFDSVSPLHLACGLGDLLIVKELLGNGADVNVLFYGANVNRITPDGETCLANACFSRNFDLVK